MPMGRPDPQLVPQMLVILERLRAVRSARALFLRRWASESSSELAHQFLGRHSRGRRGRSRQRLLIKRAIEPDD